MFALVRKFLGHVLPGIVRPLHVMWNEVIGFMFVVIGVIAAFSAWRYSQRIADNTDNVFRVLVAGFFAAVMLGFGLSSFWKARKIARS